MPKLKIGDAIPAFSAKDQARTVFSSEQLSGKIAVIYFYPKDDTPGCTAEACSFRDHFESFTDAGVIVIGISADTPDQHRAFAEKYNLPFTLLSDVGNTIRKAFGVPKSMMGLLPGRVTYVIDQQGVVQHIFSSQLNPTQHVTESLQIIAALQEQHTTI